ncbi:MAG: SusC/RagA family TonB-linked outer membrane protein [Gemmatimonadaceae bacterium]
MSPHRPSLTSWGIAARSRVLQLLFVPLVTLSAAMVHAQASGVVAGTVLESGSLQPVAGAQLTVQGTGLGAATDASGRFRIQNVSGDQVTLEVRRLGFRPHTQTARVGDTDVRVVLTETVVALDQVVVTGTAGGQQKREIGNSVATIQADDLVEQTAPRNMQQLLNGRAPGVFVAPGTGMVGSGQRIRVRGQTTFSLPADPLIYIDGVRINNEPTTGISVQGFSSGVVSRFNDINPEDVESIEILKGPAAATLYGTEASRGVINVITKKGSATGTRYTLSVRQGAQWFYDPEGRLPVNYWRDPSGQLQSLHVYEREKAAGNELFRTGYMQGYTASVGGGAGSVRYYVSGDFDKDEGVDPTNDRDQFSGRANVQITPSETFNLDVSTGYIRNDTRLACEAGCGGRMFWVLFNTPQLLPENCPPGAPFGCGLSRGSTVWPNEPLDVWQINQHVHRITGSLTATWRPLGWMTHRFTVGRDVTSEENSSVLPFLTSDTTRFFWGPRLGNGFRNQNVREVVFDTYDYAGSVNFDIRPELRSTTSVGVHYYTKFFEQTEVTGEGFPVPDVTTVDAAATKTFTGQNFFDNKTLGVYAQQQFGWRDRLFITGAVRVDNNSAFGTDVDFVTYPKVSLSWVLNEEPFFERLQPSWVNTFRLRTAYGESGQQPDVFAAVRTFAPVSGPAGTSAVTPSLNGFGNPDLKPERGRELELGFDVGLLNDRLGLDLTYYRTVTKDAILLQGVPPSDGFPGSRFVNAGEILNHGIEAVLRGTLLDRRRFGWDVTLNLATNDGEVKKLIGADTTIVVGNLQHRIGYPASSWFWQRVVSADFDPVTGRAINAMCDDGNGGATLCFDASGRVVAPRVFLGRTTPSTEGSISSTFRFFERFRLFGMLDFKRGHKKFDNNLRARCQVFPICLERVEPERADPRILAQMQTPGTLVDFVINDASFARLREVSLSVDVPPSWVRGRRASLNVAMRNIHTWTDYTGLDPEVMFLGGGTNFGFEQDQIPHPRQIVTTLSVNF